MKRWLVLINLLVLFAGCSPSLTGQAAQHIPDVQVAITKTSYDPLVVYVQQGTTVTWTNKDSAPHTITLLGLFDSGVLGRRHQFSHTFEEQGTYTYTDLFEQNERVGKVVVR